MRPEVVQLELFTHRFAAVARQMGERLRRTAVSTNVKERLDFSCALLDSAGELVVNAPHIPVHLGALGLCVRRLGKFIAREPGDLVFRTTPGSGAPTFPTSRSSRRSSTATISSVSWRAAPIMPRSAASGPDP